MSKKLSMVGKVFKTKNSGSCEVIEYSNNQKVLVEFLDFPCKVITSLSSLRSGEVRNPNHPSVYGVGFIGVGKYNSTHKRIYNLWLSLLCRACSKSFKEKHPTYKDVTVCDEWLNFQNFAKWCYNNKFYDFEDARGRKYELDKDILVKGNKIYSPDTCCFVPKELNLLLRNNLQKRGALPVGVSYVKKRSKYLVTHKANAFTKFVGHFDTAEEAFTAYKDSKESLIKDIANKFIENIDVRAYNALLNYEVDILD